MTQIESDDGMCAKARAKARANLEAFMGELGLVGVQPYDHATVSLPDGEGFNSLMFVHRDSQRARDIASAAFKGTDCRLVDFKLKRGNHNFRYGVHTVSPADFDRVFADLNSQGEKIGGWTNSKYDTLPERLRKLDVYVPRAENNADLFS